jgi:hypothetical protein
MKDYFHAMCYHMLAKVFREKCMNGIVRGYSIVHGEGRRGGGEVKKGRGSSLWLTPVLMHAISLPCVKLHEWIIGCCSGGHKYSFMGWRVGRTRGGRKFSALESVVPVSAPLHTIYFVTFSASNMR